MYGEDLGVLKGKAVRKKTDHVKIMIDNTTSVDARNIVLNVDLMYILGLVCLVTVSRNIRFITATILPDQKKSTIVHAFQQVMKIYKGRGHAIESIEWNMQIRYTLS
jgi:hypothetical protein